MQLLLNCATVPNTIPDVKIARIAVTIADAPLTAAKQVQHLKRCGVEAGFANGRLTLEARSAQPAIRFNSPFSFPTLMRLSGVLRKRLSVEHLCCATTRADSRCGNGARGRDSFIYSERDAGRTHLTEIMEQV